MLAGANNLSLKSLNEALDVTIVVDSREQDPLPFTRFKTVSGNLLTGDYSVLGLESWFSIERKSIADLVVCCVGENRERFEGELHRIRGFRFKRLLIVGSEEQIYQSRYRSAIPPKAVMATLGALRSSGGIQSKPGGCGAPNRKLGLLVCARAIAGSS